MKVFLKYIMIPLLLALACVAGAAWYWAKTPVHMESDRVDYLVESGSSPRAVAKNLQNNGVKINERAFSLLARISKQDTKIKAGAYEIVRGDTPYTILQRMVDGHMLQSSVTLIEGWSFKRIVKALYEHPDIANSIQNISTKELLEVLNINHSSPEGMFYPDTYIFVPGTKDIDILRRAHIATNQVLTKEWKNRSDNLPLKSPYEALILASIVEKETGHGEDRFRVAGVFINRLRINMALQTDPTVIYGMGDKYNGRIRKKDLQTDTPWNTYTRVGLPPTPIASPGRAAIHAALNPEEHNYMYFVSRGDGTSEFSKTLAEHNRAVAKYILRRKKN